jgi:hypothetical protein
MTPILCTQPYIIRTANQSQASVPNKSVKTLRKKPSKWPNKEKYTTSRQSLQEDFVARVSMMTSPTTFIKGTTHARQHCVIRDLVFPPECVRILVITVTASNLTTILQLPTSRILEKILEAGCGPCCLTTSTCCRPSMNPVNGTW